MFPQERKEKSSNSQWVDLSTGVFLFMPFGVDQQGQQNSVDDSALAHSSRKNRLHFGFQRQLPSPLPEQDFEGLVLIPVTV